MIMIFYIEHVNEMCVPKRTFNLSYFKSFGSFTGHINKLIFEILKLS